MDGLTRRNAVILWFLGLLWLVGLVFYPPGNHGTRLCGVVLAASLALGLLALWWRYAVLRWSLIALYAVAAIFWFLTGRTTYDRPTLRLETARALRRYEAVRYYWGGENRLGVDCSGLVRRGATEALFLHGLRTANPWLVRKAVDLWWRDMSASDLGFGARGEARRLFQAKAIKGFNDVTLYPGDFAVTEGGAHTMAYLGDHLWIEADPEAGRVIVVDARTTDNPWFEKGVSILRWRFLEAPRPGRASPR